MSKRVLAASAVILFAGALSFLAAENTRTQTWKGYVTDSWCGLDRETRAPSLACTKLCIGSKGAKWALYDVENKKMYLLAPAEEAAKYAAQMVTVTGTLGDSVQITTAKGTISGSTIIASSISQVPSTGVLP